MKKFTFDVETTIAKGKAVTISVFTDTLDKAYELAHEKLQGYKLYSYNLSPK
jgi:hypothetical protein